MVFHTRKGLFRGGVVTAVSGVSLTIARGETLALVGESGSGKTTVGRISLRLLQPTGGRVLFDGEDITQVPEERLGWLRKRAAIVFQDPFSSLNPYMTVSDLVAEPLVIDGVSDAARDGHGYGPRWRRSISLPPIASCTHTRRRCPAGSGSESGSPAR